MDRPAPHPAPADPQHAVDIPVLVRRTRHLLEAGVPLTLLIDLVDENGPHSVLLYEVEGGGADWPAPPPGD